MSRVSDERVLDFVIRFKEDHDGNSPTTREIMDALGLRTTSAVFLHLRNLERAGALIIERGAARGIRVVGGHWQRPAFIPNVE